MLNFDPQRWLQEHERNTEISGLATLAGSPSESENAKSTDLAGEQKKRKTHPHPAKPANIAKVDAGSWGNYLDDLDPHAGPASFDFARWYELVTCSWWLLDNYGKQAARDGWSTADVFGVRPDSPGAGGLVDRLGSARNLVMESKRARWRSFGNVVMRFNAGTYPDLPAFWECGQ